MHVVRRCGCERRLSYRRISFKLASPGLIPERTGHGPAKGSPETRKQAHVEEKCQASSQVSRAFLI